MSKLFRGFTLLGLSALTFILLMPILPPGEAKPYDSEPKIKQVFEQVKAMEVELVQLQHDLDKIKNDRLYRKLNQQVVTLQKRVDWVQKEMRVYHRKASQPAVESDNFVSDDRFKQMLRTLRQLDFSSERVNYLKDLIREQNRFTCDQAAKLVSQFTFSQDQVTAAVAIYPALTRPNCFSKVLQTLEYSSDREEVRRTLRLGR